MVPGDSHFFFFFTFVGRSEIHPGVIWIICFIIWPEKVFPNLAEPEPNRTFGYRFEPLSAMRWRVHASAPRLAPEPLARRGRRRPHCLAANPVAASTATTLRSGDACSGGAGPKCGRKLSKQLGNEVVAKIFAPTNAADPFRNLGNS